MAAWQSPARASGTRNLAALATALAGLATIASSLSPNAPARERLLEALEPSAAQAAAHAMGLLGGIAVVWLGGGVRQGRRSAGRAAVVVLVLLATVHTAKGLDYEEALLGLAVAFLLQRGLAPDRASRALVGAQMAAVALAGAYRVALTVLLVRGRSPELGAVALHAGEAVVWAMP